MLTLKVNLTSPLFINVGDRTVEVYTKRSSNTYENFIGVIAPRDVKIFRVGAHSKWPRENNTTTNKEGKQ